jgi:hypothetical protein
MQSFSRRTLSEIAAALSRKIFGVEFLPPMKNPAKLNRHVRRLEIGLTD